MILSKNPLFFDKNRMQSLHSVLSVKSENPIRIKMLNFGNHDSRTRP